MAQSFLVINGYDVPVLHDSAGVGRVDLQAWGRSASLTYEGSDYRKLRQWEFETPLLTAAEAAQVTGWVEGRGSIWTFARYDNINATTRFTPYSADAGIAMVLSTGATLSASAKFGPWALQVNTSATVYATVDLAATTNASTPHWTWSGWKADNGGTYSLCNAVYDGATLRYFGGGDGTTVTTAFAWATFSPVSNMFLRAYLRGLTRSGAAGTTQYSYIQVLPYAASTTQLAALGGAVRTPVSLPYTELAGSILGPATTYLAAKGFITDAAPVPGTKYGVFQPLYTLKIRLEER